MAPPCHRYPCPTPLVPCIHPSFIAADWSAAPHTGITALLRDLVAAGIPFKDLKTEQSSLEDIFVTLVKEPA